MVDKLLFTLSLIFFTFQGIAQVDTAQYKIFDTKTGKNIQWTDLLNQLSDSQIILWGEEHNDSIGHLLQTQMLKSLHVQGQTSKHKPLAFSMEMFETDVQPIMDEYLAGWISEKNFKKESRSWNNYKDYEPMVNFAKQNQLRVVCANAPARYTNMVTRGTLKALDVLPKATKQNYLARLPFDTLTGRYADKFLEIMGGHHIPNMYLYQSQNLWDATMANSIIKASKTHRIFHINGRFHTDEYLGTAARVLQQTKQKVNTISCFAETSYNHQSHKILGDFVIITKPQEKLTN